MKQEYDLDKHYESIASLFMLVWYILPMILITFDVISHYWIWLVILTTISIKNIIQKQIKRYCIKNKIPIQKIVKFGKISNWIFYLTIIGALIFSVSRTILYQ